VSGTVLVANVARKTPRSLLRVGSVVVAVLAVLAGSSVAVAAGSAGASTGAILKAGLIVPRDVPSAWTSTTTPKNPELLKVEGIAACAATRAALSAANRGASRAFSRKFVAPDQIGAAQDVVFVARNDSAAQSFATAYDGPQGRACVQAVVDKIAKQASGSAVVTPLTDLAGLGDQALGYEFLISAPNHGAVVTGVYDLIVVRVGRAVTGFQFQNAILPLPERTSIVGAVVTRFRTVVTG
jgi:hypothetical protein